MIDNGTGRSGCWAGVGCKRVSKNAKKYISVGSEDELRR